MIASVGRMMRKGGGGLSWPAGMKEHIKAIYDPAKQGMTNYDVIESYAEDFSSSSVNGKHGEATVNGQKITVTNVILKERDIVHVSITDDNYYLMLHVSGMTVSNQLRIAMYHNIGGYEHVNLNNGINKIYISGVDRRIFIEGNVVGECNITITQLPTSILKDLSGNGNHAYLYGGKGKLNSGMGVYQTDFSSWNYYPSLSTVEYSPKGLVIKKVNSTAQFCASDFVGKFTAEVSGIPEGVSFYYRYIDKTTGKAVSITLSNGINEVDCSNANGDANMTNMFLIGANNKDINITITQIPNYPNQLCYDGKMYAVCYGFPILTDYTVMADRTWFDKEEYSAFVSNSLGGMEDPSNGAFSVEVKSLDSFTVMSFGSLTSISTPEKGITYQTKQSYNGISINVGTRESNDVLTLGGRYYYKNDNNAGNLWNGCHGKIIIADRSFTEDNYLVKG